MRGPITLAVLVLSLFPFSALTQQSASTGTIEGIVVRSDTDQPIANAQVTLTIATSLEGNAAAGARGGQTSDAIAAATTGADGKFTFNDVKPATYRLAASANGFIRQEYGQGALYGSGRLLFVVRGQPITNANIRITPAGTLTGRVLDENGQPATGAPVQLFRVVYTTQGKTYQRTGGTPVDDRGNFRLFEITPGRYYLLAGTLPMGIDLAVGLRGGAPLRPPRYSPVYHPNATTLEQATMIEVKAGSESSVDIRVKRETQRFHVRGRVINATSEPLPQDLVMTLGFRALGGGGGSANVPNSFDPATGTFDLANVPTGDFIVGVSRSLQPGRGSSPLLLDQRATGPAALAPITVTNSDIDGLVLTLTAAVTMRGKLIVEGQPLSAVPSFSELRINIRSVLFQGGAGMPVSSPIAEDGSFQVTGLREDEYRAQMSANVPGFYVKSIRYGEEDILGKAFKVISGNSRAVEVILKAGTQTIGGTVTDAKAQPVAGITVALVPAQFERLDLFRSTVTDSAGKFSMTDLPPGEYKVFSWEAADDREFMNPNFLKQHERFGKAISVGESSNSSIDVKLIPAQ